MKPTSKPAKTSVAKRKRRWFRTLGKIAAFGILFVFILSLGVGGWAYAKGTAMYNKVDLAALNTEVQSPTIFFDMKGGVINELTNAKIDPIPFAKIPKTMVDAIVAVEDSRFFEHKGVDLYAMARAFYRNLRSGQTVEGGSTITQQLAKTMLYSPEQSYTRKINEAIASIKIEKNYTKEQILEMYLNHIFYGDNSWGLQRAAQNYFGKDAPQLTLAESALLAGLPKAPSNYSPAAQPEKAKERRNLVLNLMAEQGKISADERDKAKSEPINLFDKSKLPPSKYASYVDQVMREATAKFGMSEQQVLSGGYKIYTNLDPNIQDAAEEVYKNKAFFPEDKGGLQSGVVLMDAKTGAVRGIVGSRTQESGFRGFNYATQNERQPGSAIKPIVVYTPALLKGIGPQDMVNDVETDFSENPNKPYKPNNYGKQFHGWVTVEEALAQSYNIPAVAVLKEAGIGPALDFAKQTGLPLTDNDRNLSIALGGMSKGTSPLKMAQAYSIFANQGKLSEPYTIAKIVASTGQTIKQAKPVTKQLIDPSIAYTMTQMLEKVVLEGTGTNARMDRPVAGKTGTTQLPDIAEFKDKGGNQLDGSKDAWFVGYTPELVAAVWVGYPQTNKAHYLTSTGGKMPAAVFKEVMSRAMKGMPVTAFAEPKGYTPMLASGIKINDNGSSGTLTASDSTGGAIRAQLETLTPAGASAAPTPTPSASAGAAAPGASPGAPPGATGAPQPGAGAVPPGGSASPTPSASPGASPGPGGAGTSPAPKPPAPTPTPSASAGAGAPGGASAAPSKAPTPTPAPGGASGSGAAAGAKTAFSPASTAAPEANRQP